MTALALVVGSADVSGAGWVHGLELVAVPVVAVAVLSMRRSLAPDLSRLALAAVATAVAIAWHGFGGQAAAIVLGGVVGVLAFRAKARPPTLTTAPSGRKLVAVVCLAAFGLLLLGLAACRRDGRPGRRPRPRDVTARAPSSSAAVTSCFHSCTTPSSRRGG